MKLQKIKSLCTKSAVIRIYEAADCQWLSDGTGIYPVYNLPKMTDEQIYALFDIPEDKKGKVMISRAHPPSEVFNFNDTDPNELLLERIPISVGYLGKDLLPLIDFGERVTCITAEHLAPFADLKEGYGLYLRMNSQGGRYIAVKKGLLLIGIILPSEAYKQESFENAIRKLGCPLKNAPDDIRREQDTGAGAEANQLSLDEIEKIVAEDDEEQTDG